MTAQLRERLLYKGKLYGMTTEPLKSYLASKQEICFVSRSSACWRGYFSTWELRSSSLFIIKLNAFLKDSKEVDLNYLFPGKNEVFADWFTGDIIVPHGKLLQYVHMGYQSIYEKEFILSFNNGILISEKKIVNQH